MGGSVLSNLWKDLSDLFNSTIGHNGFQRNKVDEIYSKEIDQPYDNADQGKDSHSKSEELGKISF